MCLFAMKEAVCVNLTRGHKADTRDKNDTISARNCSVFCHRGVRPHPDAMVGFKCMLQRLHKSTIHSV